MEWLVFGQIPHQHYEGTITARDPTGILAGLSAFWHRLFTATLEAYPEGDWDAFECTLWANSGRIIAYPYQAQYRFRRQERVFVQVRVEALEEEYYTYMYDPEGDSAEKIRQLDEAAEQLIDQYWRWLVEATIYSPTVSLLENIRQHHAIVVYACEEHPSEDEMMQLPI
jgi:hypothetical protein